MNSNNFVRKSMIFFREKIAGIDQAGAAREFSDAAP
jgi:hypothetical protein